MLRLLARLVSAALLAAFVTAAVSAGWAAVRLVGADEVDWPAAARSRLEPLLAACAGAAVAAGVLHLLAARRRRRLLALAERHLAALREEALPDAPPVAEL